MTTPSLGVQTDRLVRFIHWLDGFGELSYDHHSFFAGDRTRTIKELYFKRPLVGTLLAAPMVFCETVAPSMRTRFWKPQRFPIADAHYAMGFAHLASAINCEGYYDRAVHFLEVLEQTRSEGFEYYCWGDPYDRPTRNGTIAAGTPLITAAPYAYEAFQAVYELDSNPRWLEIMRSIADHAYYDYRDFDLSSDAAACASTTDPKDPCRVVHASAYRAFLLTRAAHDLNESRYLDKAQSNLQYVLDTQNDNGSWPFATDGEHLFVDHFPTCFVMKALAKIEKLTGDERCTEALDRGVTYYLDNLFDEDGLPRPHARRPRIMKYKRDLYDIAECINLGVLLRGRYLGLDAALARAIELEGWEKPDGSFRSRKLRWGWDNVPMHRWAQSQLFRALSCLLLQEMKAAEHPELFARAGRR